MKDITLLLFLVCSSLNGQDTFISKVRVNYDIIWTRHETQHVKGELLFNPSNSVFRYRSVGDNENQILNQENELNDYAVNINVVHRDTLENRIYHNKDQNSVIKTAFDFNTGQKVFVKDTIDRLNWKISTETKNIRSFECAKATLKYKGKSFIAWFTTEIPTSFGPYIFGQLSGLILELYSEDRHLYVAATQITYPFNQRVILPEKYREFISEAVYKASNQKFLDSIAMAIREKSIRILTKSQRGVNISNVRISSKRSSKNRDN